jgi:hypothetical protein
MVRQQDAGVEARHDRHSGQQARRPPDAIRALMEAVKQGELDIQIEDVAEQGTAELRLRAPLKPFKKVS